MKFKIDKKTTLSAKLSKDKSAIVMSSQVEDHDGNIFLNTITLSEEHLEKLLAELIILKAKLS